MIHLHCLLLFQRGMHHHHVRHSRGQPPHELQSTANNILLFFALYQSLLINYKIYKSIELNSSLFFMGQIKKTLLPWSRWYFVHSRYFSLQVHWFSYASEIRRVHLHYCRSLGQHHATWQHWQRHQQHSKNMSKKSFLFTYSKCLDIIFLDKESKKEAWMKEK